MTILLIDDDPEILHIAGYALQKLGHRVVSAATGAEAVDRVRTESLDVIVMDVVLPDIEAPALLDVLRGSGAGATPIVLLTARRTPDEASHPGVIGVIQKPFDPLALGNEIDRLIAGAP
jgi:CheY-like chemotaxis protein